MRTPELYPKADPIMQTILKEIHRLRAEDTTQILNTKDKLLMETPPTSPLDKIKERTIFKSPHSLLRRRDPLKLPFNLLLLPLNNKWPQHNSPYHKFLFSPSWKTSSERQMRRREVSSDNTYIRRSWPSSPMIRRLLSLRSLVCSSTSMSSLFRRSTSSSRIPQNCKSKSKML